MLVGLMMEVVFTVQHRYSEMYGLRFLTWSTSFPLTLRPECSVALVFHKLKMSNFILLVLRLTWFSLQLATRGHASFVYGAFSSFLIGPTMAVSSANVVRVLEPWMAIQTWVYSVYNTGQSPEKHPY